MQQWQTNLVFDFLTHRDLPHLRMAQGQDITQPHFRSRDQPWPISLRTGHSSPITDHHRNQSHVRSSSLIVTSSSTITPPSAIVIDHRMTTNHRHHLRRSSIINHCYHLYRLSHHHQILSASSVVITFIRSTTLINRHNLSSASPSSTSALTWQINQWWGALVVLGDVWLLVITNKSPIHLSWHIS